MQYAPIRFPGLGITLNVSPVAFSLGGLDVRWYGLLIACGFLLALLYADRRRAKFGITEDHLVNAVLWGLPVGILCARIYYCIFDWGSYRDNPISCLYIWEGGLAIYGGVIGAAVVVLIYCRRHKLRVGALLDLVCLGLLIGQCIGRWGNFFNREVYGRVTDSLLRMELTDQNGGAVCAYHPLFLYESVWNLAGFILLHFYSEKRKFDGEIFLLYVGWYGLGRGILEGMRMTEFNLMIPGTRLPVSQIFAFATCLVAVGIWLCIRLAKKPDGSGLFVRQTAEKESEKNS